jgi:phage antirepressor YoqD-like protein
LKGEEKMTENIDTIITDKQFQSTDDALKIAKKALSVKDYELYEQARDFYYRETSQMEFVEMLKGVVIEAVGKGDLDMFSHCIVEIYSYMPATAVRTYEISNMVEARYIVETLLHSKIVNIADEGSAANLLAAKALDYAYENGSREIRDAILEGANPQLYELMKSPLEEYEVLKPTSDVADRIAAWTGPVCINACAKILEISPHTFSASIVRDKYCFRRLGKIVPYSQYEKRGWFSRELVRAGGSGHTYRQTFITPIGVYRFMEIYNPHQPPESAFLIAKKHQ